MANDRLRLQCEACRETFLLVTYYPWSPSEAAADPTIPLVSHANPMMFDLIAWLESHLEHHPAQAAGAHHMHGIPGFRVITEAEPSGEICDAIDAARARGGNQ